MVADNARPCPPPGGEAREYSEHLATRKRRRPRRREAAASGKASILAMPARRSPRAPDTGGGSACGQARGRLPYQMAQAVAGMTAGTAIRASLTVPGRPEQVQAARVFVGETLGAAHPGSAVAVLLVSELVTNSVLHSDSGRPGKTITITVIGVPEGVRVEVLDAGGASAPFVQAGADDLAEHGRGLRLVSDLSARWGYRNDNAGLITWFEVEAETLP